MDAIQEKLDASAEAEELQTKAATEGADALSEAEQEQLDEAIANGEILTAEKKKQLEAQNTAQRAAYMRAFVIQKAMAIASIAIDTARSIMSVYAQLPFPAAVAASIALGALGVTQAAVVAGEQPQFEEGGLVTEEHRRRSPGMARGASVNADLHVGEGVLTSDTGMRAVGGARGLQLANLGVPLVPAYALRSSSVRGGSVTGGASASGSSPPPFAPGSGPGGRAGGRSSASGPIMLTSVLDGKVVDKVTVSNWQNGRGEVKRLVYSTAGVRVGLDRG
jgi:hypothetical protein